jgi:hypothetical protein
METLTNYNKLNEYLVQPNFSYSETPPDDIKSILNYNSLIHAISYGKLNMIKWMVNANPELNSSLSGTMWEREFPFKVACANGKLEVAKWLKETKPDIDISIDCEDSFRYACSGGFLDVCKWLYELNPEIDVSVCFYTPFSSACNYGHLELAKWLYQTFPQIREELQNRYSVMRKHIILNEDNPDISRWINTLITGGAVKEIIYSNEVERDENSPKECCICYEKANLETSCGHFGCEDCFALIANHDCPYCRQFITDYFKIKYK